jgi:hypothetical protein
MEAGGKVVLLTGPFGEPERTIALDRPMAIAELVAAHELAFRLPTIAVMAGEPVLRGAWALRMVRPGDVLAFIAVPGGGGGSPSGKQIGMLVAAIALSVAAPFVGTAIAGALFAGSTVAASIASAAFLVGGSLLLNMLMPPAAPDSSADAAGSVYSASAASNTADPLGIIPPVYGRMRFPPRYAARPYAEYQGNDQYLYQLFCLTPGAFGVEKIEIGETEAWNPTDGYSASFSDLTFEIVQPGDAVTLFPANVVTSSDVSSLTVPDSPSVLGPFVLNASGTTIDRIAVDFAFPGGLFTYDSGGKGVTSNSIPLRAEYQEVDNSGTAVGSWHDIFRETITSATRTPQRLTRAKAVTAARYQVRFSAGDAFDADDTVSVNTCVWAGLRGYLTGFVTPANCTLLAMKVRANEQISQASSSQISVTGTRWLPVWDGTSWADPAATTSIAWAAADLLRNADYGLGLDDSQYDLAALLALDTTWSGRADSFNAIFDSAQTARDALTALLRAGRTQFVRIAGKIGFARLEAKSIRRAVFTPRNVVRGSFQHKLVLFDDDAPDSVNGSYFDATVWDTREVLATIGALGSEAPQDVAYFGITDHDQTWREAITDAAINAYQREFVTFTAEWEGKLLIRGEPILVQHPFIEGVAVASLAARAGDVLTVDRDLDAPSGDGYVILRDKLGLEWGPGLIASMSGRTITLDATDRASVEGDMGALDDLLAGDREEPAHLLLCDGETRPFNGLVVSASPDASGKVSILAVIDAPEVYAADGTETMPSPWAAPTLPAAVPDAPAVFELTGSLRSGVGGLELDAMWLPAAGATSYVAQVSYDSGDTWTPVYSGAANRFTVPVSPQLLDLRVAAVGKRQGPWATKTFSSGDLPPGGGYLSVTAFADTIAVPAVVGSLPATGSEGDLVVLTTDGKLYRYHAGAWTAAVATVDLTGTIITAQIASAAITASQLATAAVTAVAMAASSVATAALQVAAVTSAVLASGAVVTAALAGGAVTSAIIANGAVVAAALASGAVTSAAIAANTIVAGDIAANTITAGQILAGTITSTQIAANTIIAGDIAVNTITAGQIAAGTVTATQLAAGTITATQIAAGTIVAANIAAGTITGDRLVANTITASKVYLADYTNLIADSTYADASAWSLGTGWSIAANPVPGTGANNLPTVNVLRSDDSSFSGGTSFQLRGTAIPALMVDVEQGVSYAVGVTHKTLSSAVGRFSARVAWFDSTNTQIGSETIFATTDFPYTTTRQDNTIVAAPTGAAKARVRITRACDTSGNSTGWVAATNLYMRRAADAQLIVDGSITALKVAANTITSAQIAANTITASQIAANTITAGTIAAGAIGASELAAGAITAGKISAGAINASSLMVDGVVITAKIAAQNATNLYSASFSGHKANSLSFATLLTFNVPVDGYAISIGGYVDFTCPTGSVTSPVAWSLQLVATISGADIVLGTVASGTVTRGSTIRQMLFGNVIAAAATYAVKLQYIYSDSFGVTINNSFMSANAPLT